MQAYNISMHVLTLAIYFRTGTLASADLSQFLIVAPAMLIPSYMGARVCQRFKRKDLHTSCACRPSLSPAWRWSSAR